MARDKREMADCAFAEIRDRYAPALQGLVDKITEAERSLTPL